MIDGLPAELERALVGGSACGCRESVIGAGGILVEGLHIVEAAPLFIGGNMLAIWMVAAGARIARGTAPEVEAQLPTSSVAEAVTR